MRNAVSADALDQIFRSRVWRLNVAEVRRWPAQVVAAPAGRGVRPGAAGDREPRLPISPFDVLDTHVMTAVDRHSRSGNNTGAARISMSLTRRLRPAEAAAPAVSAHWDKRTDVVAAMHSSRRVGAAEAVARVYPSLGSANLLLRPRYFDLCA